MKRQMNRQFHKHVRALAVSLCGILMTAAMIFGMARPVMAQDFVLPVTQTMDVLGGKTAPTNDVSVTYTLTAENGGPLPDGAANGKYVFSIAGNEQAQLTFSYDTAGDYSYVLERTGVTGVGGGMIDGDPEKVQIVNTVNMEDRRITAAVTILEGTYDVGKKMTECSFDYKCALKLITGTPAPSSESSGDDGTGGSSDGTGGGSTGGGGNGSGSTGGSGNGSGANGNGGAKASNVRTGDESNVALYFVMMVAAIAVVTVCTRSRRLR